MSLTCVAVIPARGGSKGLPGKNILPLAGLPLIAHSIACAGLCPEITRTIVSTDSEKIAGVARAHGGEVPFLRPPDLARDETPMLPVMQHALTEVEKIDGRRYDLFLLLDPTSPGRTPEDIAGAFKTLAECPAADGIVGVSQPEFNPYWHCVVKRDGFMVPLIAGAQNYTRRQDVPPVWRINASLYLFRRDFLLSLTQSWFSGKILLWEIPESRAIHIDDEHEFQRTELFLRSGLITFPWLKTGDLAK